jgi:hypothetical protein
MTAKEYLSRYHQTKEKIDKLQGLVDVYIRLANEIPGIQFDQVRVDGGKNLKAPFEKWILKAMEYEAQIVDLKRTLPIIKEEILTVIEDLEDEDLRKVLILRYFDWLTWNQIASKMYISYSTSRRMHNRAVTLLKASCFQ